MKHIFTIISTAILFLFPLSLSAQQVAEAAGVIRGVVRDDLDVMMNATVTLENKDGRSVKGTLTDYNGTYTLEVPKGETGLSISVSYVGYVTQKVPYTGQTRHDVKLVASATELGQVVVQEIYDENEYYDAFGMKREDVGYATTTIDITEFQEMAVVSVEDMLAGKVAGLDIFGDGDPGSIATIRIRGTSSLNANNEPLIVIDGIPIDTEIDSDFDFGDATVENFGALVNISPNDIQNIEVLSDAGATTLWGDKAANGVLLITTRQGGAHTPNFDVSEKLSYTISPKSIDLLTGPEYKVLMQEAMWNWIVDGEYASDRYDKLTNQKDILFDRDFKYFREYNQRINWMDLVEQNAFDSETNFSMDGGGEKVRYRFSLNYNNHSSSTVGADFQRLTSRLNVTYIFSKNFRVQSNFDYAESTQNKAYEGEGNPRSIAMKKMPNMSPWVLDENGNFTDEYFNAPADADVLQSSLANPVALIEESTNRRYERAIGASFSTSYQLFKGFSAYATVSFRMNTTRNNQYLPESAVSVKWADEKYNKGVEALNSGANTYLNLRLNYNVPLPKEGKHRLNMGLVDQISMRSGNNYSLTTSGNGSKEVSLPSAGGKVTGLSSGKSESRSIGLAFTTSYAYDDRFTINPGVRVNANSGNALGSKWGDPRPTVNGVWKVHNETWMKPVTWINDLFVGYSFGRTEQNQSATKITGTYSDGAGYYGENWAAIAPDQMQLYNLKPEITTSYDVSLRGSLFKDGMFNFNVRYYQQDTKNQTQSDATIPSSTGFSKLRVYNSGKVQNRGVEASVNLRNIIKIGSNEKNQVKISFDNVNFARNRNRIMELPSNMEPERYTLGNGNVASKVIAGSPIGSIYGFKFDGIYQNYSDTHVRDRYGNVVKDIQGNTIVTKIGGSWAVRPGDVRYKDLNYDGSIDEYDIVYIGNSYPSIIGGATLKVQWKTLTFRTSVQMRIGHDVLNNARLQLEQMSDANNQSKNALARWRYEGEITEIPRALWGTNYNSLVSDLYVEDASYFKIKDITISYKIPQDFVKKFGLKDASVYINAYNILTLTKYSGVDPEVSMGGGAYSIATDNSRTPPARRIAAGLSFRF